MKQATIIILGANGRVGQAATLAFAQAGWRVIAQVRRQSTQPWPSGVEATSLPLNSPQAWAQAYGQVDWVLHAINPLYPRWSQEALPLAEQGMNIAQAVHARWVLPGNVYNFGQGMPSTLHPQTPFAPSTRKGRIRVAMEALAQQRSEEHGLPVTVLRAGDFFGHGQGSWLDLMIARDWRRGKLVYPGARDQVHAWAYLPDLALHLVALAQRRTPLPQFENLHFAGHALTGEALLQSLQSAAAQIDGRTREKWRSGTMPWWLIRLGGWLLPMWREVLEMRYLWDVPHALQAPSWPPEWGPEPTSTPIDQALVTSLRNS